MPIFSLTALEWGLYLHHFPITASVKTIDGVAKAAESPGEKQGLCY